MISDAELKYIVETTTLNDLVNTMKQWSARYGGTTNLTVKGNHPRIDCSPRPFSLAETLITITKPYTVNIT